MRGLVAWESVEELRGSGDREREEQPIRLGGRERCLGCGRSCLAIPQLEVRDAGEQVSFNEREGGADGGCAGPKISRASNAAAGSRSIREMAARPL